MAISGEWFTDLKLHLRLLWIARHSFYIFSTSKYYSLQNKSSYFFFVTLLHLIIWQNRIYCLVQDIGGQLWVSLQILLVAFEVIKKNVPALNDHFRFLRLALPQFHNPIQFNCTYGSNTISEFWALFFPKFSQPWPPEVGQTEFGQDSCPWAFLLGRLNTMVPIPKIFEQKLNICNDTHYNNKNNFFEYINNLKNVILIIK